MKVKRSVALAIRDPARPGRVLLVQRPPDDEDLPDIWGLPAASLHAGESWEDTALRAGADKLGVVLELAGVLQTGSTQRDSYRLDMRLYSAGIRSGVPSLPRTTPGVTQYQAWRWGTAADLQPAADRGSLCSRLFLAARP